MGEDTTTVEVKISTYQKLNGRKLPGDSFDDVIARLIDDEDRRPSQGSQGGETGGNRENGAHEARPADVPRPRGGGNADVSRSPDGDRDGGGDSATADPLDDLLAELDLPGNERRVEAVRACVDYLREKGVASRSDFLADVYPDHRAGVSEGRWWDVVGKQGLRQVAEGHPEIEPPGGEGAHNYEWIG